MKLAFWDVLVGLAGHDEEFDGGSINVLLTFPEDESASIDLGTYTIHANPRNPLCNVVDGAFSYREEYGLVDEFIVVYNHAITHNMVMFANITITPAGGTPTTRTFPFFICALQLTSAGGAGVVYISRTRSLPDTIQSTGIDGKPVFYWPVVLATYLNRETAEAAYAEYGSVFDNYVKNCIECDNGDCGEGGHQDYRFENGELVNISQHIVFPFHFPENCAVPTNWVLWCLNDDPGTHGTVEVIDDEGNSIASLAITTDPQKFARIKIPPCTDVYIEGKGGGSGGPDSERFSLWLEEDSGASGSGSGSAEPDPECTQEIQDSWELVPKTQEEWDELHNGNELLSEMGE